MRKPDYIVDGIFIENKLINEKTTKESFKEIRKHYHMTQKEIADFLEIPLDTWRQWETGRREPPKYMLKLILYSIEFKMKEKNK